MTKTKKQIRGRPFAKGKDPRRHQLTPAERSLGGIIGYKAALKATAEDVDVHAWLFRRIRSYYRRDDDRQSEEVPL